MIARIKKNDTVIVRSGKDKGAQGTVLEVLPKEGKVLIKGVGLITRHVKARKQGDIAGIRKEERHLQLSQVMPLCSSCKKACRVTIKVHNNAKMRACHRCEQIIE
jgi:large subunit ribosomal protein L24